MSVTLSSMSLPFLLSQMVLSMKIWLNVSPRKTRFLKHVASMASKSGWRIFFWKLTPFSLTHTSRTLLSKSIYSMQLKPSLASNTRQNGLSCGYLTNAQQLGAFSSPDHLLPSSGSRNVASSLVWLSPTNSSLGMRACTLTLLACCSAISSINPIQILSSTSLLMWTRLNKSVWLVSI